MFFWTLNDLLSGSWDLIWHQGLGIGLIICFLAASYFSPVFKKDFFYAAVIVGIFLLAEDIGIHDANKITAAKEQIVNKELVKAVQKSKTPKAQHAKDPWNNKDY